MRLIARQDRIFGIGKQVQEHLGIFVGKTKEHHVMQRIDMDGNIAVVKA